MRRSVDPSKMCSSGSWACGVGVVAWFVTVLRSTVGSP